jgi:hypothetical protein
VVDAGSTILQATVPAGTLPCDSGTCPYDVIADTMGGGYALLNGALTVSLASNPLTCATNAGASVLAWWTAKNYNSGTGNWTDASGNGNTAACVTGGITYSGSDSNWNSQPSLTLNGTSGKCSLATLNLGGSNTTLFVYAVTRTTSSSTTEYVWSYDSASYYARYQATNVIAAFGPAGAAAFTGLTNATPYAWYGYTIGGTPETGGVNVGQSLSGEVGWSYAPGSPMVTSGDFQIGWSGSGNYFTGSITDILVLARTSKPSNTEILCDYDFFNAEYALDQAPTLIACTTVPSTGGLIRCQGSHLVSGTTLSSPGIGNLSTTFLNASTVQATVPAGVYTANLDIAVTNPDGDSFTLVGAVKPLTGVGASCDSWTSVNTGQLIGIFDGDNIACSGTCSNGSQITSAVDLSMFHSATTLAQGTSANQPTWNQNDVNWGGHSSLNFNATSASQFLTQAAWDWNGFGDISAEVLHRESGTYDVNLHYLSTYSSGNWWTAVYQKQLYTTPPSGFLHYGTTIAANTNYEFLSQLHDAGTGGAQLVELNETTTSTIGTRVTGSAGSGFGALSNLSNIAFGASNSAANGLNGSVREFDYSNPALTTSQEQAILTCWHARGFL